MSHGRDPLDHRCRVRAARAARSRLDLEVELGRLREEHTALTQLADRIVAFLKTAHGDDSAEAVQALEDAVAEAIAR